MTIRATGANYLDAYAMYNDLYSTNSKANDATAKIAGNYSSAGTQTTSGLLNSQGREELSKALDAMKQAGYTRFTFADVENYRKQLESEFSAAVRSDLTEMGVDPKIEFNLNVDADGNIQVVCDHEDKAVIEQYFADNPEMVDVFKHIQALSNLRKTQSRAPDQAAEFSRAMKLNLQAEAVQAFFEVAEGEGMGYFNQIATFSSTGATSYFLGLNQTV